MPGIEGRHDPQDRLGSRESLTSAGALDTVPEAEENFSPSLVPKSPEEHFKKT